MRIKKEFMLRQVCGENAVMGEGLDAINFGRLLALNETAAWLWQQAVAMGDFNVDNLTTKLCEEYEVAEDVARKDVAGIIQQWQEVGVIE